MKECRNFTQPSSHCSLYVFSSRSL